MAFGIMNPDDPDAERKLQQFFSPQQIDQMVRQGIQFCWMCLPADKRNVAEVEAQFRRIVDRALRDLREDAAAFGMGTPEGHQKP